MIKIIVKEYNTTLYHVETTDGTFLGHYREPLLSAARELLARGYDPGLTLGLTRDGTKVDMSGTIGKLAKWTVKENNKAGPVFARFESYPSGNR